MRFAVFLAPVAECALYVSVLAQTSAPNLKLDIASVSPTDYGYEVVIKVTNAGKQPVVLGLSATKKPKLQSLDIQQCDGKAAWQSVGPCLDTSSDQTAILKPDESLIDIVPIGDTSHGWTSSVCPRPIAHLGGTIRPVVYCSFTSERNFRNRMNPKYACKPIEGSSSALPTRGN
jgi:hypothetical protein